MKILSGSSRTSRRAVSCWSTRPIFTSPARRTCSELVGQDKDLLILRTFSKIYGMAGLRAGAAMARPDLLKQLGQFTAGALPSGAMAAAAASLKSANLVEERRKIITDIPRIAWPFCGIISSVWCHRCRINLWST